MGVILSDDSRVNKKYSAKRVAIILQGLSDLKSRSQSAKDAGITYKTYCEWYNVYPEFKEMVDNVLITNEDKIKQKAIDAITNAFDSTWTAAAWWLERRHPAEYAKKDKLDITTTEKKIIFQIGLNQSEETPNITITGEDQKLIEE